MLSYFIQVNIYITILALCYQVDSKKLNLFKFGRSFLLLGLVLSFLLPLLEITRLDFLQNSQLSYAYMLESIDISAYTGIEQTKLELIDVLLYLYLTGVMVFLIRMIYALYTLLSLKLKSVRRVNYFELPNSSSVFSFFHLIFKNF